MAWFLLYFLCFKNIINMTICIDNVKTRIETVKKKTDDSIIDEASMNEFLDAILLVKKILNEITGDIDGIVDDMYESPYVTSIGNYLEIKPLLDDLYLAAQRFYDKVRKSPFYSGVESSMTEYLSSIESIEEMIYDIDMSVRLSDDEEFKEITNKINKLFA